MPKCDICGKVIKNPKLSSHINSNFHQAALNRSKKTKGEQSFAVNISLLNRIALLEKQVKFLMNKVGNLEIRHSTKKKMDGSNKEISRLQQVLLSSLKPGRAITIDEIFKINKFKKVSLKIVERIINDLVDDELIDVSEGNSNLKLTNNIGMIIKR